MSSLSSALSAHASAESRGHGTGTDLAGEVDYWRLDLGLNELGSGFLAVERYLESG